MDTVLTTEWGFLLFFMAMWVLATLIVLAGRRWLGKDMMKYLSGDYSCDCCGHHSGALCGPICGKSSGAK